MSYRRLTRDERYQIVVLMRSGLSIRQTAIVLGRSPSTICRELTRNRGQRTYNATRADKMALRRRQSIHPPLRLGGPLEVMVRGLLERQWSPQQIAGRLRCSEGIVVSHKTIYRYIFQAAKRGDPIFRNLRRKKKHRLSHKSRRGMKRCGRRDSYPSIDLRPEIVEARDRLGDYERDTIVGSGMHKGPVLLAIVDRASRRVHIAKLPKVDANFAHQATVRLIKDSPVLTITNDNGPEFADYTRTASILNAPVYFNDPYASWQRGTNENTNGLIRQYFPRGTDFSNVTEEEIQQVEQKLNNRPRKIHGY